MRAIFRALRIAKDRVADVSLFQWLFPATWTKAVSAATGMLAAFLAEAAGTPFYLWLPLGLLALVLALAACHLILHFNKPLSPRSPFEEREPQQPLPDMLIHDLFLHIRADILENAPERRWETVGRDVMDRFSTGQLLVWGREIDEVSKLGGPLTSVPRDYWRDRWFVYSFLSDNKGLGILDGQEIAHTYSFKRGHMHDLRYGDLRVDRAQAFSIWPQRFKEVNIRIRAAEPRRGDS